LFKDISDRKKLTVHSGSASYDCDRKNQSQEFCDRSDTPQLKFLVMDENQRLQELAKTRRSRLPKRTMIATNLISTKKRSQLNS